MELKRLITQFTYRIEAKPEGGFIAHASDANMPALEAPTREELQKKIQATIMAGLSAQFPGLGIQGENGKLKLNFHIESKPGGGFALHSGDANAQPVEGTQEEIESRFAETMIGLAEKFSPELRQALANQVGTSDIKVFVDRKTFTLKAGSHNLSLSTGQKFSPAGSLQRAYPGDANGTIAAGEVGATGNALSDAPIIPERSNSWSVFLFALTVLVVAALLYFVLYRR